MKLIVTIIITSMVFRGVTKMTSYGGNQDYKISNSIFESKEISKAQQNKK